MVQGELPFETRSSRYDRAFAAFDRKFPEVYTRLVQMARQLKARGFRTYSIKTLWCVLRFQINLSPTPVPYKLNDIYHSRYGRLIMEREKDLAGFFRTRELRS